ncbi:MAG: FAD binding domain-containing protein [Acidimicrobiia bacterium]
MYPREFDYVVPTTLDEALRALAGSTEARVLAGGHSLIPMMKLRLVSPDLLVDISRIPGLSEIRDGEDHLVVGALARHAEVATSSAVREHAASLAAAASMVGDPQVRNRGTVGGSLAHADAVADEPGPVLALGGMMVARAGGGSREIPAAEFFVDTLTSALKAGEILTEIRLPKQGPGEGSAYDKLGRRGGTSDYPIAGAAAWVRMEGGVVTSARVAITGASTRAILAEAVSEALVGTDGSDAAVAAAAGRAADGLPLLGDLYGSEQYKAHLAAVYARRAILGAIARAGRGASAPGGV